MRIVCDFDGTITRRDTVDHVLEELADPAWRDVEARWVAGEITAAECMRQQVAMIDASDGKLDALLDTVELDPDFAAFAAWCQERAFPLSIVSDGVDHFIKRILARHGLEGIPITSNVLVWGETLALEQPWARAGCAAGSGVCKCAVADRDKQTLVYVGDGRSDFCVSGRADILFAKASLADYAAARGQPFHPFETFADVTAAMARLTGEALTDETLAAPRAAVAS